MSNCSCAIALSLCSEIGLPMKSDNPAKCALPHRGTAPPPWGLATMRYSRGLNCGASRRISRRMS